MHAQHLTIAFAGMVFGSMSLSYFIYRTTGKLVRRKVTLNKKLKKIRKAA